MVRISRKELVFSRKELVHVFSSLFYWSLAAHFRSTRNLFPSWSGWTKCWAGWMGFPFIWAWSVFWKQSQHVCVWAVAAFLKTLKCFLPRNIKPLVFDPNSVLSRWRPKDVFILANDERLGAAPPLQFCFPKQCCYKFYFFNFSLKKSRICTERHIFCLIRLC